jgi:O-antigen/teichoic acid export membrane protein
VRAVVAERRSGRVPDLDPGPGRRGLLVQIGRLAAGRLGAAALSAGWIVMAARHLIVPEFGDLVLLLSVGMIFATMADCGLSLLLSEVVALQPTVARSALVEVVRKRLALGVAASGTVVIAYVAVAADRSMAIPLIFAVSMLSTTVYTSASAVLRSQGRVGMEAVNEVVSRAIVLGLGTLWLTNGGGLRAAVVVYAVVDVASAVVLGSVATVTTRGMRETPRIGSLSLRRAAPLAVSSIVATLYYRVDIWLLSILADPRAVALYASSYRLVDGILLPSSAIGSLTVPSTAQCDAETAVRRLAKLSVLALSVVLPVAIAIALYAPVVLRTVYGEAYAAAGSVLVVLLLAALPTAVITVVGPRATLTRGKAVVLALLACLTLNVLLNILGVPRFGIMAAAWATVVCQWLLLILVVGQLRPPRLGALPGKTP